MNTALSYRKPIVKNKGISTYNSNEIMNLSPVELILKIYDFAIVSIKKGDVSKANRAITELISSLDFDHQEISLGFFRLYRYCQDCLQKGNFNEALNVIDDLRQSWAKAFNLV